MTYFGKFVKNFFLPEKNPPSSFKIGGIFEKKNEITIGRRPFFERTSEAKCPEKPLANLEKPLANLEKPLPNECGRRVHLTTTPLSCQPGGEAEWYCPLVRTHCKRTANALRTYCECTANEQVKKSSANLSKLRS